MFKPTTLVSAMNQARLMENTLEVWSRKCKFVQKPSPSLNTVSAPYKNSVASNTGISSHINQNNKESGIPIRRLSRAEYNARKEKGLCFTCNEKYTFGHKCAKTFQIMMEDSAEGEIEEEEEEADLNQEPDGEIRDRKSTRLNSSHAQ